jgi:hypothetical protein
MIERRAHVVNSIPDDQRPFVERLGHLGHLGQVGHAPSVAIREEFPLVVRLKCSGWVWTEVFCDLSVETVEMVFGTRELCSAPVQWMTGHRANLP